MSASESVESYLLVNSRFHPVASVTNKAFVAVPFTGDYIVCSSATPLETALLLAERVAARDKDKVVVFSCVADFSIDDDGMLRGYSPSGVVLNTPKAVEVTKEEPPKAKQRHWWDRPWFKDRPWDKL